MSMLPTEGCVAFGPGPNGEARPVHVVLEEDGKLQHQLHQATLRKGRFMKGKGVVYQVRGSLGGRRLGCGGLPGEAGRPGAAPALLRGRAQAPTQQILVALCRPGRRRRRRPAASQLKGLQAPLQQLAPHGIVCITSRMALDKGLVLLCCKPGEVESESQEEEDEDDKPLSNRAKRAALRLQGGEGPEEEQAGGAAAGAAPAEAAEQRAGAASPAPGSKRGKAAAQQPAKRIKQEEAEQQPARAAPSARGGGRAAPVKAEQQPGAQLKQEPRQRVKKQGAGGGGGGAQAGKAAAPGVGAAAAAAAALGDPAAMCPAQLKLLEVMVQLAEVEEKERRQRGGKGSSEQLQQALLGLHKALTLASSASGSEQFLQLPLAKQLVHLMEEGVRAATAACPAACRAAPAAAGPASRQPRAPASLTACQPLRPPGRPACAGPHARRPCDLPGSGAEPRPATPPPPSPIPIHLQVRLLQQPRPAAAKLATMAGALHTICTTAEACAAAAGTPAEEVLMQALDLATQVQCELYPGGGGQQQQLHLLELLWQQLAGWMEAELLGSQGQWREQRRAELAGGLLRAVEAAVAAAAPQLHSAAQQERCLGALGVAVHAWPSALAGEAAGEGFRLACELLPLCLQQQRGGRQLLLEGCVHYLGRMAALEQRALAVQAVAPAEGALMRYSLSVLSDGLYQHVGERLAQAGGEVGEGEAVDRLERFGKVWDKVMGSAAPRFVQ
jgi:hypothetical protein